MVDSSDSSRFSQAAEELHSLIMQKSISSIPLLVLCNKSDLSYAVDSDELAKVMRLDQIKDRPLACMSISAKHNVGIQNALEWVKEQGAE